MLRYVIHAPLCGLPKCMSVILVGLGVFEAASAGRFFLLEIFFYSLFFSGGGGWFVCGLDW